MESAKTPLRHGGRWSGPRVSCRVPRCTIHASSGADDRNTADPSARSRCVYVAQHHSLHWPAGAIEPPISSAPLQPSSSRRDDVHARAGARCVFDRPVPFSRHAQPACQRARRQRTVHDDQSDPIPAIRSGRAHHPVPDGRYEPRLLAAQPHSPGVEDAPHGAHSSSDTRRASAGQSSSARIPVFGSMASTRTSSRGRFWWLLENTARTLSCAGWRDAISRSRALVSKEARTP